MLLFFVSGIVFKSLKKGADLIYKPYILLFKLSSMHEKSTPDGGRERVKNWTCSLNKSIGELLRRTGRP